jgi:uncharacterized lipoprotein YajG
MKGETFQQIALRRSAMKYLSILLATLLLASCSTTGMSSGDSMSSGSSTSGSNSYSDDCSSHPVGLYCGD